MGIDDLRLRNQQKQIQGRSENQQRYSLDSYDSVTGKYSAKGTDGSIIYGDKRYNSTDEIRKTTEYGLAQHNFEGTTSNEVKKPNLEVGYLRGQQFTFYKDEFTVYGKIKYAYTTVGSDTNKTALYISGHLSSVSYFIEEWNNSEYSLVSVCLDNLGGISYILSYVLQNRITLQYVYKTATQSGTNFTLTLDNSNGSGNSINSIGYGNWINNQVNVDSNTQKVLRISDPNINLGIPNLYTETYEIVNTGINPVVSESNYTAYISPKNTKPGKIYSYGENISGSPPESDGYRLIGISKDDSQIYTPVRFNTRLNKGLYNFTESSLFTTYTYFLAGPGFTRNSYTGDRNTGIGLVDDGNYQEYFVSSALTGGYPLYANTVATVNTVLNSNIVYLVSGTVPPVGAAITGSGIISGSVIINVQGSYITLNRNAITTLLNTQISWGFNNLLNFTGSPYQVDLFADKISLIYQTEMVTDLITQNYSGGTYTVAKMALQDSTTPVSIYEDTFVYRSTKLEKFYAPKIVNKDALGRYVFSLKAVSYYGV